MLQSLSRGQLFVSAQPRGFIYTPMVRTTIRTEPDINDEVPHEVGLAAARNSVSLHSPNASEMLACIGLGKGFCIT